MKSAKGVGMHSGVGNPTGAQLPGERNGNLELWGGWGLRPFGRRRTKESGDRGAGGVPSPLWEFGGGSPPPPLHRITTISPWFGEGARSFARPKAPPLKVLFGDSLRSLIFNQAKGAMISPAEADCLTRKMNRIRGY